MAPLADPDFLRSSSLHWPRRVHDEGEAILHTHQFHFKSKDGEYNWVSIVHLLSLRLPLLTGGLM